VSEILVMLTATLPLLAQLNLLRQTFRPHRLPSKAVNHRKWRASPALWLSVSSLLEEFPDLAVNVARVVSVGLVGQYGQLYLEAM
jgi:hypothetical protein